MEKRNCNEEERIPNDVITFSSFILFYFLMSNHVFSVSFVSLPHLLLLPTYGRGGLCELNDKINLFFSLLQAGHTLILRRSLGHLMLLMTLLFFFFTLKAKYIWNIDSGRILLQVKVFVHFEMLIFQDELILYII